MRRFGIVAILLLLIACQPAAMPIEDDFSSDLPLTLITTNTKIQDEPKISANLKMLAGNERNYASDAPNAYDGVIGIEMRGQTSQGFPKKQYGFETRDADGENLNTDLLGLPEENDWILHAPYSDKSLLRNVLAYDLARNMGHYASRTVFTELILNGDYQGLYILLEKVKRDKNRVDITSQKDDLTGGYILELTQTQKLDKGDAYFVSPVKKKPIAYVYPDADDLEQNASAFIRGYISDFETALYSDAFTDPEKGYRPYLDIEAAVDYMIIQELFKNIDAFSTSFFMHKDAGEKLAFGPVWDFNLSSGNFNNETRRIPTGWILSRRPWAEQLLKDPYFVQQYVTRWQELSEAGVFTDMLNTLDRYELLLAEAQLRNFERWSILGKVVWPNPAEYTFATYEEEVDYLRSWLIARTNWLDEEMPRLLE